MTVKATKENQNSEGKSGLDFICVPQQHLLYHTEIFEGKYGNVKNPV